MRVCKPDEFLARWPGSLNPVRLPGSVPGLPDDLAGLLRDVGLPREIRIRCYNDVAIRFSGALSPLAAIWERDLERGLALMAAPGDRSCAMPVTWSRFWHIADQEYTQGGGWLCLEGTTGRLVLIDLDQTDPIYQVNAGLLHFYTTLAYFLEWTETTAGTFDETRLLRDALHKQCLIPLEELEPFWMNIIDATLDQEECLLRVTLS